MFQLKDLDQERAMALFANPLHYILEQDVDLRHKARGLGRLTAWPGREVHGSCVHEGLRPERPPARPHCEMVGEEVGSSFGH